MAYGSKIPIEHQTALLYLKAIKASGETDKTLEKALAIAMAPGKVSRYNWALLATRPSTKDYFSESCMRNEGYDPEVLLDQGFDETFQWYLGSPDKVLMQRENAAVKTGVGWVAFRVVPGESQPRSWAAYYDLKDLTLVPEMSTKDITVVLVSRYLLRSKGLVL